MFVSLFTFIGFSASDIVDGMCYCDNKQGKSWVLNVVCKIMDGKSIEESTAQTLDQWRGNAEFPADIRCRRDVI